MSDRDELSRPKFSAFLQQCLRDPAFRATFEDARSRHEIVDALVARRHLLGLTQADVADAMGVGQPTVSGFENEGSDPRLSTLQRYARAVGASLTIQVRPDDASSDQLRALFVAAEAEVKRLREGIDALADELDSVDAVLERESSGSTATATMLGREAMRYLHRLLDGGAS